MAISPPPGTFRPFEDVFPEYAKWRPPGPHDGRREWFTNFVNRYMTPEQLDAVRVYRAQLRGLESYAADCGVESMIKGPDGSRDWFPRGFGAGVNLYYDAPDDSKGVTLGRIVGSTVAWRTSRLVFNNEAPLLSRQVMAWYAFLARQVVSGSLGSSPMVDYRLDQYMEMTRGELCQRLAPRVKSLGAGGTDMLGQFLGAVGQVVPGRTPRDLGQIARNSHGIFGRITSLSHDGAQQAAEALCWDGDPQHPTGVRRDWHKRYFEPRGNGDDEKLVFGAPWYELRNPESGRTFAQDNIERRRDPRQLFGEGCSAMVHTACAESDVADVPKPRAPKPNAFKRTFVYLTELAEHSQIFDANAPHPGELMPGAPNTGTGPRALERVDEKVNRLFAPRVDVARPRRVGRTSRVPDGCPAREPERIVLNTCVAGVPGATRQSAGTNASVLRAQSIAQEEPSVADATRIPPSPDPSSGPDAPPEPAAEPPSVRPPSPSTRNRSSFALSIPRPFRLS